MKLHLGYLFILSQVVCALRGNRDRSSQVLADSVKSRERGFISKCWRRCSRATECPAARNFHEEDSKIIYKGCYNCMLKCTVGCTKSKVFTTCASKCPATCKGTQTCESGCDPYKFCRCPRGMVQISAEVDNCVDKNICSRLPYREVILKRAPITASSDGIQRKDKDFISKCWKLCKKSTKCPQTKNFHEERDKTEFAPCYECVLKCTAGCGDDKIFSYCTTQCPSTCDNRGRKCGRKCNLNNFCKCKRGTILDNLENNKCITAEMCPDTDRRKSKAISTSEPAADTTNFIQKCWKLCEEHTKCPTTRNFYDVDFKTKYATCYKCFTKCTVGCSRSEDFIVCASACPRRCDDKNPVCTSECNRHGFCQCKSGMVLHSEANQICVPEAECEAEGLRRRGENCFDRCARHGSCPLEESNYLTTCIETETKDQEDSLVAYEKCLNRQIQQKIKLARKKSQVKPCDVCQEICERKGKTK